LQLSGIRDQLDSLLDEAARANLSARETLILLCEREIARKDHRRIEMALKLAHCRYGRSRAIPACRPATGSSWPSISQRCHDCAQRRRVNCARDPHPSPGRELNLDRTAASGGRRQRLPVGRNGDCRKTDFAILPLHRLGPASEDACARLPPPGRNQIAVNVMSPSNLDNTGSRRQTLLNDPKLLGTRPPPSPLWTGQNRNRRHVCSFACELMSKSSHARTRSGKAVSTGGLPFTATARRWFVFAANSLKRALDAAAAHFRQVPASPMASLRSLIITLRQLPCTLRITICAALTKPCARRQRRQLGDR
jgi:hypothetical protein